MTEHATNAHIDATATDIKAPPSKAPPGMDPGLHAAHRIDKIMAELTDPTQRFVIGFLLQKYTSAKVFFESPRNCNAPPLE